MISIYVPRLQHTRARRTVRYDKLPPRRVRGNLARCRRSRACRAQRMLSNRPKKGPIRSTKCPFWSNKGHLRSLRGHLRPSWGPLRCHEGPLRSHPGQVRRAVRRLETFLSRAALTESSCSVPPNFAPNPQAIKVIAISYVELTERSDYTRFASVFCDIVRLCAFLKWFFYDKLRDRRLFARLDILANSLTIFVTILSIFSLSEHLDRWNWDYQIQPNIELMNVSIIKLHLFYSMS